MKSWGHTAAQKKKKEQIQILAQLNACSEDDIKAVLTEAGIDLSQNDGRKMGPRTRAGGQPRSRSAGILAALKEELAALDREAEILPEQIRALQQELDSLAGKKDAVQSMIDTMARVYR